MSFQFNCPHCNETLEAEDGWVGQETVCPRCSRDVKIVQDIASPPAESIGSGSHRRFHWLGGGKKYVWGRLFIVFIWGFVGLALVAGAISITYNYMQYSSAKTMRREKLWQNIPILQKRQNEFTKKLQDTIDLLAEKQMIGREKSDSEITGFKLPDSVRQKEFYFNDELDSVPAVEASLKTAGESIEVIKELERCIENSLRGQLRELQTLIEKPALPAGKAAPLGIPGKSASAIRAGFSKQVDFFLSERDQFKIIQAIRGELTEITRLYPNNRKVGNDIEKLTQYLDFIENNLFNQSFALQLDRIQGGVTSQQIADIKEKKEIPGEREYRNILQKLSELCLAWSEGSGKGKWYIAIEAQNLQDSLAGYLKDIRQEETVSALEWRGFLFFGLKTLFFCVALSFALLVISDFLRAHFDGAENSLKK